MGANTTITLSKGVNKDIETTAIAVLAWLNDPVKYAKNIEAAIFWLSSYLQVGTFGSTQATVLSLKALTSYMTTQYLVNATGSVVVNLNGTLVGSIYLSVYLF